MSPADPNIGSVEIVAAALGDLCDELVLVGGCAVGLRAYLVAQFAALLTTPDFFDLLPGLVAHDTLHSRRVAAVSQRLKSLAAMHAA